MEYCTFSSKNSHPLCSPYKLRQGLPVFLRPNSERYNFSLIIIIYYFFLVSFFQILGRFFFWYFGLSCLLSKTYPPAVWLLTPHLSDFYDCFNGMAFLPSLPCSPSSWRDFSACPPWGFSFKPEQNCAWMSCVNFKLILLLLLRTTRGDHGFLCYHKHFTVDTSIRIRLLL